jgi:hypothetical protein
MAPMLAGTALNISRDAMVDADSQQWLIHDRLPQG